MCWILVVQWLQPLSSHVLSLYSILGLQLIEFTNDLNLYLLSFWSCRFSKHKKLCLVNRGFFKRDKSQLFFIYFSINLLYGELTAFARLTQFLCLMNQLYRQYYRIIFLWLLSLWHECLVNRGCLQTSLWCLDITLACTLVLDFSTLV